MDGGKLREAATKKNDDRILLHILNKDCVAVEVKYHRRCYKRYVSPIEHINETEELQERIYGKSFDSFCAYVKKNIIDDHNIFYMTKLKNEFVRIVKDLENEDASNYRAFRLKQRLKERFPQLVFHTPKVRNRSEIVYTEDLSRGNVAEILLTTDEQSELNETEDEEMDELVQDDERKNEKVTPNIKELYLSALALKENIRQHKESWYDNWPPLSSDITGESVKKIVSPLLFNFISWLLGYSDEPEASKYVNLEEKLAVKVFSICQDIVYNNSKGKTQTPKSLALAMSVRQISGCTGLIDILNGLGHCASISTTMSYDTAIAQLNINTANLIPKEFVLSEAVNIVYDNIDFGEEITKQTHVTNGIVTQRITSEKPVCPEQTLEIKKSQRTVKVPASDVVPFSLGVKKTPKFHHLGQISSATVCDTAQKLDLAYVLIKSSPPNNCLLPGWTGFNTMLCEDVIPPISRIGYLPVIDASPTEFSTIDAILKRCMEIANKLQLRFATLIFDEAIYSKVQQVRWKNDDFYNRFVVRLGEFHVIMSFLSSLSKIFQDGGLKVCRSLENLRINGYFARLISFYLRRFRLKNKTVPFTLNAWQLSEI